MRLIICLSKKIWVNSAWKSKSKFFKTIAILIIGYIFLTNLAASFLSKQTPAQIVLFSATFPDRVRNFASKFAPNANKIELKKEELSVEGIKQFYMDCKDENAKYEILVQIYNLLTVGQSIIFTKVCY